MDITLWGGLLSEDSRMGSCLMAYGPQGHADGMYTRWAIINVVHEGPGPSGT